MSDLEWGKLQSFLAVAQAGRLTLAARRLGIVSCTVFMIETTMCGSKNGLMGVVILYVDPAQDAINASGSIGRSAATETGASAESSANRFADRATRSASSR